MLSRCNKVSISVATVMRKVAIITSIPMILLIVLKIGIKVTDATLSADQKVVSMDDRVSLG